MSNYFNDDILNESLYNMANPSKNTYKDLGKVADHFLKVKESDPRYIENKRKSENEDWIKKQAGIARANELAKQKSDSMKKEAERIERLKFNQTPEDLENFRAPSNSDKWVDDSNSISNKNNKPDPKIPSATIKPQTLTQKAGNLANQIKSDPKGVSSDVYNNHKGAVAGAAVGAAAAIGIGAIISNILKKRKWKLDGCNKIQDPSKKKQCKEYIAKKNMNDINSQCKYANNPEKCKRMAMEKIRDI